MKLQGKTSTVNLYLTSNPEFGTDFLDYLTSNGIESVNQDLEGKDVEGIYRDNQFSNELRSNNRVLATKEDIFIQTAGAFSDGYSDGFLISGDTI